MIKQARFWIGIAISVACLAIVARGIDPQAVGKALVGVNYWWLLPALAIVPPTVYAKALRWRRLFRPRGGLRVAKLYSILMIGYLISSILPARLGDPARAVLANQLENVRTAHALATVIIERLLDVITLLVFLLLILPFVSLPEWLAGSAAVVGLGSVCGFAALLVLGRYRERFLPAVGRWATRVPRLRPEFVTTQLGYLLSGFDAFASASNVLAIVGWSVAVWALSVVQNQLVLVAMGIQVPPSAAVMVLVVNALGMLIPSSPGYIGVFHYLTVLTLGVFGVEKNLALSLAIVLHLITFIPLVLLGTVSLGQESLSFGRVSESASKLEG